jgi:T5SS/PEP-CTERM-associated repeat protein
VEADIGKTAPLLHGGFCIDANEPRRWLCFINSGLKSAAEKPQLSKIRRRPARNALTPIFRQRKACSKCECVQPGGGEMRTHLLATTAVMALLSASTVSTRAQTFWTGAISSDWFTAGNWSGGVPTIGTTAFINTLPNATVDGAVGAAAAAQFVAVGQVGAGSLTIQNGGTLTTFTGLVGQPTGKGDVTVTGPGSLWTNFNSLQVGGGLPGSIGTLTVADGGIVNGSFFLGRLSPWGVGAAVSEYCLATAP